MEQWAIVELMGHVRIAGRVSEEERFGSKLGRIDIPDGEGFVTQLFSGGSVYRLTYCSEAIARQVASISTAAPVQPWEFPKALPSVKATPADFDDVDIGEDDVEDEIEENLPY